MSDGKFFSMMITFMIVLLAIAIIFSPHAKAHDSWISQGGFRNQAGEWCCGTNDCVMLPKEIVGMDGSGYIIVRNPHAGIGPSLLEHIPFVEAQKSPDGEFWRCHRPDGSRRCFFAPPPSM